MHNRLKITSRHFDTTIYGTIVFVKPQSEKIEINGKTYVGQAKLITEQLGIPTLYFDENNARPIPMKLKRNREDMCPELFSYLLQKERSAGSISKKDAKDITFWLLMGGAIGGLGALAMAYTIYSQWGPMIEMIPLIKVALVK